MQKLSVIFFFILLFVNTFGQSHQQIIVDKSYSRLSFSQLKEQLLNDYQVKLISKEEWTASLFLPEITQPVALLNILKEVLSLHQLDLIVFQQNIVVLPAGRAFTETLASDNTYLVIGNRLNKGRYTHAILSGQVTEGSSGLPIPGAQLTVKEYSLATTTNRNGYYELLLPTGPHHLSYSFMGLNEEQRNIALFNDGSLDVELYEKTIALDEISVGIDQPSANYRDPSMGMARLSAKTIKKLSVLMGEPDVIKSMLMLPGVQTVGENAAGFNVRGGTSDQNLILVHDATLFNTSHLFGLFSMLDANLVKNVSLYKSSVPSRYGGRLSSVMQIVLDEGNSIKTKTEGGIGLVNSRLSFQGPFGKKATFMVGGRSTYSDWILRQLPEYELQQSAASFYDLHAKLDYTIEGNSRLSAFVYKSNDYFDYYRNARYEYGNLLASARWKRIYTKNQAGLLSWSYSLYNSQVLDVSTDMGTYSLNTDISQQQIAYHHSISTFPRHLINAGINVVHYYSEPGKSEPYGEFSLARQLDMSDESSFELAVYLEDEYDLSPMLSIVAGLRYSHFLLMGPDEIRRYTEGLPRNNSTLTGTQTVGTGAIASSYHGIDPRLSLRYEMESSSSVKAGFTRTRQYIRQLSNSAGIAPADYWKAADSYLKPLLASQYSLGYFRNFYNDRFETSIEFYYKSIDQVNDFKNGAVVLLNPHIEQALISGKGQAYGAELMLKKAIGKMSGWITYTYSRSMLQMKSEFTEEQINRGEWYPSNYDKPHDLSLVFNFQLSKRFSLASNFTYSTGRPATFPEEKYQLGNIEVISYSDRNRYRLPDYHRIDFSLTYEGSLKRKQFWRSSWTLSVYNAYGRKNPFSVFYERQNPSPKNNYQQYALYQFSVIGVPIPSFTYNFWF